MLILLSSLGFLTFFAGRLRIKLSIAMYLHVALTVLWLYAAGLAGLLRPGAIISVLAGMGLLAYTLIWLFRRRAEFLPLKWSAGKLSQLLYLVPFVFFVSLVPFDFKLTGWDEFSFWGLGAKVIHATHSLYLKDSPIVDIFKAYPPAQQLFQYYFLFLGPWSESGLLSAQIIFMLAALACAIGAFHVRASVLEVLTFFSACAIPYFFGFDYKHIFVDPLLALVFAASVALAATAKGRRGSLLVAVSVAVLVLMKQIGLILAMLVIAIHFFSSVLQTAEIRVAARFKRAIAQVIPGCLATLLTFASWQWYSKSIGAGLTVSMPKLSSLFQDPLLGRIGKTGLEFIQRFQAENFGLYPGGWKIVLLMSPLSVMLWLMALSAICILISRRYEILPRIAAFSLLSAGAIAYLLFLLLSYLLFFSEYEGIRLASFERYAGTYFLAWALVVFGAYSGAVDTFKIKWLRPVLAIPILAGLLCLPLGLFAPPVSSPQIEKVLEQRERIDALAELVKKHAAKGDKVYFIDQNSTGFEKFMFSYSVSPLETQWWCWSVGEKYNKDDVWTCKEDLRKLLDGYSFVVLYNADEQFWGSNSDLFAPDARGRTTGVFRVARKDGQLVLTQVQ